MFVFKITLSFNLELSESVSLMLAFHKEVKNCLYIVVLIPFNKYVTVRSVVSFFFFLFTFQFIFSFDAGSTATICCCICKMISFSLLLLLLLRSLQRFSFMLFFTLLSLLFFIVELVGGPGTNSVEVRLFPCFYVHTCFCFLSLMIRPPLFSSGERTYYFPILHNYILRCFIPFCITCVRRGKPSSFFYIFRLWRYILLFVVATNIISVVVSCFL